MGRGGMRVWKGVDTLVRAAVSGCCSAGTDGGRSDML